MFWHSFKYAFLTLIKNRALVFWTLAFPFILAILFNLAFSRLHDYDVFEAFDIAVINDAEYEKAEVFSQALKELCEGDKKLFSAQYIDRSEAESKLDSDEIVGYTYVDGGNARVKIRQNGTNQTILVSVVEQLAQSSAIINDMAETELAKSAGRIVDVEKIYKDAVAAVTESEPNIKEESRVMNVVSMEFYTLVAMACMQGAMLSVELINRCMPNISNRGKRIAIAPTRKSVIVVSNLLSGYVMLVVAVSALILFTRFVLGVEYGDNLGLVMLLAAVGSLTATMMGVFLSIILKTKESAKNVIVLIVTMVGCLFAGMFGVTKGFFDETAPLVNKISPVGQITDGLYALLYYDDMARFTTNIVSLLIIAGVFLLLSIRGLRRQRYDSI